MASNRMVTLITGISSSKRVNSEDRPRGSAMGERVTLAAVLLLALNLLAPLALRAQYSERQDEPKPQITAEDFSAEKERKEPVAIRKITIDAELIPRTHQLKAKARIQFQALQDTSTAQFELNENLFPTKIAAEDGRQLSAQRTPENLTVQVGLAKPLPKGQTATISLEYAGNLADAEHSPIEGVQLAYIGEEGSYLLYPGRWFPMTGYSVDRYTAELHITAPAGVSAPRSPSRCGRGRGRGCQGGAAGGAAEMMGMFPVHPVGRSAAGVVCSRRALHAPEITDAFTRRSSHWSRRHPVNRFDARGRRCPCAGRAHESRARRAAARADVREDDRRPCRAREPAAIRREDERCINQAREAVASGGRAGSSPAPPGHGPSHGPSRRLSSQSRRAGRAARDPRTHRGDGRDARRGPRRSRGPSLRRRRGPARLDV